MSEFFREYSTAMGIYIINRMPNKYEGVWQLEAVYQMFEITADYDLETRLVKHIFLIHLGRIEKKKKALRKCERTCCFGGSKGF